MDWNSNLTLNWNGWYCIYLSSNLCEVELLWGGVFVFWFLEILSIFCKEVILMYAPISYTQESLLPYLFSVTVLSTLHLYQFDNLKCYVTIELICILFFNIYDSLHFYIVKSHMYLFFCELSIHILWPFFFSCIVGFLI